nr:hypothetical protein [Tanacetum cinerariifolium]
MSTLAEFMIVAGADNRPPMLNKPMYESWKSRIKPLFKIVESLFSKFKEDKVRMLSLQDHKGMLQVHGEIYQVKQRLLSAIIVKAKGKELDEEQLAFLADPRVADGQVAQTITHNAAF